MTYRDWHIGMRVVCVKPGVWSPPLVQGRIYTISGIGDLLGAVYIGLDETPHPKGYLLHWRAERFRPVQPRKTDISIFTAMLTGAKEREPA